MKSRPLRWWSAASLAEAGVALGRVWGLWCAEWGVEPGRVTVRNEFEVGQGSEVDMAWQIFRAGRVPVMWASFGATDDGPSMRTLLFGQVDTKRVTPSHAGSIATEIADVARHELTQALAAVLVPDVAGSMDGSSVAAGEPLPPEDAKAWSGALRIRIEPARFAESRIEIHLPAVHAETFMHACGDAPTRDVADPERPLVPLAAAFERHRLRLRIELEGLALDLGTLRSLACGDVVTLPHGLHEPLRVRLHAEAAQRTVCHAALGAREGRRAVELIRAEPAA